MFTHLVGERALDLNDLLTHGGFRRSQSIAYRPACDQCRACVSVRVIADEFRPSRNLRRVARAQRRRGRRAAHAAPTSEQYSVFRAYLDARHRNGGMADMTVLDYAMMVEDSHVETRIVEYRAARSRQRRSTAAAHGDLLAVALTDVLSDGLSMVYSFFEPGRGSALARHVPDPRPHRARAADGPALRLSRLLDRWLAQDGLQGALPAAAAARAAAAGCASTMMASAASGRIKARGDVPPLCRG